MDATDKPPAGAKDKPTPAGTTPSPSTGQGAGIATQDKWFLHTDGIAAPVLNGFKEALAATQKLHDLVVCARVVPIRVRSSLPSSSPMAELVLPSAAVHMLGSIFESHLLLVDGELLIWLAGMDALPAGTKITLLALSDAGPVQATAVIGDRDSPTRLGLPWTSPDPPSEIAVVISETVTGRANH